MSLPPVILNGHALRLAEVEAVARGGAIVRVGESALRLLADARAIVDDLASAQGASKPSAQAVYGVNTGFGSLAQVRIPPEQILQVQRNLVRSHAAGVGEPLPDDVVRAMLVVLAASLCRGFSGVRAEVVQSVVEILNHHITPVVPSRGSVGASGDLAPLAHAALVLIGEGLARVNGQLHSASEALRSAKLDPIMLQAKEGLALINGTHLMAGIGALALCDIERLCDAAVRSAALAIDACRATDAFLDDRLHVARRQPGQRQVARRLREQLAGSQIIHAHRQNDPRVQDPYCLRATPQVLGAAFDAILYARSVFENELGGVTDNPLVFVGHQPSGQKEAGGIRHEALAAGASCAEGTLGGHGNDVRMPRASRLMPHGSIVSGGNFHGMPLAIAMDTLKIALCHISGIAERRIYWLLTASDSENPVNAHLSPQPGLHSGMMIVQYTAAACCNELQTLAAPASVHNIPTSAGIEDYNSMGATSAAQLRQAVELAHTVIACELLVMAEAMEYQRPLRSSPAVERTYESIRQVVPRLTEDRPLSPDIAAIATLIRGGAFNAG
jgi:histidine ammonia-lyase